MYGVICGTSSGAVPSAPGAASGQRSMAGRGGMGPQDTSESDLPMPRLPLLRWFDSRPPLLTVDHPTPDQRFAGWIDVRGWAVVPSGAPLVVRISVDDQEIRVVRPSTPRPDVVAAYPGMAGTDRCGFEARLTRDELPDRDRLTLTFEVLVEGWAGRARERTVRSVPVERHASAMPLGGTGKVDHYVTGAPDPRYLVDIFAGEWSSRLPPPFDAVPGRTAPRVRGSARGLGPCGARRRRGTAGARNRAARGRPHVDAGAGRCGARGGRRSERARDAPLPHREGARRPPAHRPFS